MRYELRRIEKLEPFLSGPEPVAHQPEAFHIRPQTSRSYASEKSTAFLSRKGSKESVQVHGDVRNFTKSQPLAQQFAAQSNIMGHRKNRRVTMKFTAVLKSAAAFSVLALGFQGTAFAHKVVHVQNTLYVIICEPGGEAYTFNGTPQGATEVGGYLCPPGSANTNGGGTIEIIQARPAPRDAASGLPTGKRQHKPMTVTKELDKSTPMLAD